jgi:hypothetical protein
MNGLIAFFDILGYQSFLENNNSATESAEKVLTIVTGLPKQIKLEVLDRWKSLHGGISITRGKNVSYQLAPIYFRRRTKSCKIRY